LEYCTDDEISIPYSGLDPMTQMYILPVNTCQYANQNYILKTRLFELCEYSIHTLSDSNVQRES